MNNNQLVCDIKKAINSFSEASKDYREKKKEKIYTVSTEVVFDSGNNDFLEERTEENRKEYLNNKLL